MKQQQFTVIKQYVHWTLFLHENQCYIGRVYLLAHKNDERDFLEIEYEEKEEFFKIGRILKQALAVLFEPDRINYAMLSNKFEKLHVHIIPRYKKPRIFNGIEFIDYRWGENYAPYDKSFTIPNSVNYALRDAIYETLSSASFTI